MLHDHVLEAGTLRYIMERPMAAKRLGDLQPRDMTSPKRARILAAIIAIAQTGELANAGNVAGALQRQGVATAPQDIARFMRDAPKIGGLSEAVAVLVDLGSRRRLYEPLMRLAADAHDGDVSTVRAAIRALAVDVDKEDSEDTGSTSYDSVGLAHAALEELKARQERPPVDLGPLDGFARHMLGGNLLVIGGESNAGKSQLAQCIGRRYAATHGAKAGIVSVEDRAHVWGDRAIAYEEGVSLLGSDPSPNAFAKANTAIEYLRKADPYHAEILDRADIADVERAMLRCIAAGAGLIVVDYVQEIRDRSAEKGKSQHERISDIAARIKAVGKRARLPVILVSQLARPASKQHREPTMFELKGSGDIENMAEAIALVWKVRDEDRHSMVKVAKLKSGGGRPRARLERNDGGMITSIEEFTDAFQDDAPSWGGRGRA